MLNHVKQPTDDTCVSACLAMLLNKPVYAIIEVFHDRYKSNCMTFNEFDFLKDLGLPVEKCYTLDNLEDEYVYFLGVPSLHEPGVMHCIVLYFQYWDYEGDEPDIVVLDPNKGREGKQWYHFDVRHDFTAQGGVLLRGYAPSIKINRDALMAWRQK